MDNTEKKKGGAREGAGRKSTGVQGKTSTITLRLAPSEKELLEKKAKAKNKSMTRFLIDLALDS